MRKPTVLRWSKGNVEYWSTQDPCLKEIRNYINAKTTYLFRIGQGKIPENRVLEESGGV